MILEMIGPELQALYDDRQVEVSWSLSGEIHALANGAPFRAIISTSPGRRMNMPEIIFIKV